MIRRLSVLLAALLLAGCTAVPATPTPTAAAPDTPASPEIAASPAPTALAMAETAAVALTYDAMRPVADLGTVPAGLCTGYFTVSRDGLWGLIRADGEEILPCRASAPVTRCGGGHHWIYWPEDGIDWSEFDARNAALQAGNDGSLCPGHGGSADSFFFDLDVGAAVCYYHGTPGNIEPIEEKDWQSYGEPLPVYPAYEAGEAGDPAYPGTPQGGSFYIKRNGEAIYPQRYGAQVEALQTTFFFGEALAPVRLETGWAYLDRSGTLLTEAVYEPVNSEDFRDATPTLAASLQNGYAAVCRDGRWGLLDASGTEVIPCEAQGLAWEGTTLWIQTDGVWQTAALPAAAAETVTVDRSYEVTLDDGSPLPTQPMPLYYKGAYTGLTWAALAAQTGFAEADLRALNPDITENPDGTLAGTAELQLAEAYRVPQSAQALVSVTVPGLPAPYRQRDIRVPASLAPEAAVTLARAYYETWAEGQGLVTAESAVADYRAVTGGRFADFASAAACYTALWTGDALETWLEPRPWRSGTPTAYFAEGEDGQLLTQGYAFDSVIPLSGYTHTEPQPTADGGLAFAGIGIQTADETGAPLPADACRLLYTPVRMADTADGWRVASVGTPF